MPVTALKNTDVFSSLMKNGVRVCSELTMLLILERRLYRFISVTSLGGSGPACKGRVRGYVKRSCGLPLPVASVGT